MTPICLFTTYPTFTLVLSISLPDLTLNWNYTSLIRYHPWLSYFHNRGGGAGCAGCAFVHPLFGAWIRNIIILRTQYLSLILCTAHPISNCFHRHCTTKSLIMFQVLTIPINIVSIARQEILMWRRLSGPKVFSVFFFFKLLKRVWSKENKRKKSPKHRSLL